MLMFENTNKNIKLSFLFGILLTYWIKFSRSRKEIHSFSSHLIKFFVSLQPKKYN